MNEIESVFQRMFKCLSILVRMKHIPRCPGLVSGLLQCAQRHEEATLCLIRISLKYEGARMIFESEEGSRRKVRSKGRDAEEKDCESRRLEWVESELPSLGSTLKLFLAVFFHTELRLELMMSRHTSSLFNALFEMNDSEALRAFAVVVQSISTDEMSSEDIDALSKRRVFANFIRAANEVRDETSVVAIIDVVRHISNVQFVAEFTSVFELILAALTPRITARAIQMFAAASEWQSASRKMKKLGVDRIVREKFSDDAKLARYTKKLLANIQ